MEAISGVAEPSAGVTGYPFTDSSLMHAPTLTESRTVDQEVHEQEDIFEAFEEPDADEQLDALLNL